jgi:hypothetical protein
VGLGLRPRAGVAAYSDAGAIDNGGGQGGFCGFERCGCNLQWRWDQGHLCQHVYWVKGKAKAKLISRGLPPMQMLLCQLVDAVSAAVAYPSSPPPYYLHHIMPCAECIMACLGAARLCCCAGSDGCFCPAHAPSGS